MISTDLFRKPTDARNYLNFDSEHPISCKNGITYGQFLKVRRICSDIKRFDVNALEMAQSFLARGYPLSLVETALIRPRRQDRDALPEHKDKFPETDKTNGESMFLITMFNPCSNVLKQVVDKNLSYLTKNPKFRGFEALNIKQVYRRPKYIREMLVRASLPSSEAGITKKTSQQMQESEQMQILPKTG